MDSGRPQISDTQKAVLLQVFLLFLLVAGVLGVLARTLIKYFAVRRVGYDDGMIFVSVLLYVAQTALLFAATGSGFGNQEPAPTPEQLETQMKYEYVATMLQLLSIAFAKVAYLDFVRALTRVQLEKRICDVVAGVVGFWAVSGLLVGAFQCKLPHPWDFSNPDQCINREAWWLYVTILNVITEVILIALPFRVILRLQINQIKKKIPALTVFSFRILVIIPAIFQYYYYSQALRSDDAAFYLWQPTLCGQFVQSMAIVTASFLYIKLLIDSLESGFLRVDDQRRREGGTYGASGKNNSSQGSRSRSRRRSTQPNMGMPSIGIRPLNRLPEPAADHDSEQWPLGDNAVEMGNWDRKQARHGIMETRSYTVETHGL